jgi:hypothetical protein
MKWWDKPSGTGEVSQHLVRVFNASHEQADRVAQWRTRLVDRCKKRTGALSSATELAKDLG